MDIVHYIVSSDRSTEQGSWYLGQASTLCTFHSIFLLPTRSSLSPATEGLLAMVVH